VGGIGHDDRPPLVLAAFFEVRFCDEECGKFAMRAGRRIERERRHPENRGQRAFEIVHHMERALREFVGCVGMEILETRQRRHRFVNARVVLHRARAQRIEAEIDRERAMRETRVVPHDVEFAVIGKREVAAKGACRQERLRRSPGGEIGIRAPGFSECEDRRFVVRRCENFVCVRHGLSRFRSSSSRRLRLRCRRAPHGAPRSRVASSPRLPL